MRKPIARIIIAITLLVVGDAVNVAAHIIAQDATRPMPRKGEKFDDGEFFGKDPREKAKEPGAQAIIQFAILLSSGAFVAMGAGGVLLTFSLISIGVRLICPKEPPCATVDESSS